MQWCWNIYVPPSLFRNLQHALQKWPRRHLSKFQNIFVQISHCISPNFKIYFSKYLNVYVQISKCIYPNKKISLSQFLNTFLQISKCISLLSNLEHALQMAPVTICPNVQNILVPISKCICPNF